MTISSLTARNDYTGNGAVSVYSYTWKVFSKNDLKVVKRDTANIETTLTVDTDYTVSGVGDVAGGSITLTAGNLPTNYKLTIRRQRALTQNTDLRNQGDFFPEVHEDALDGLTMVDQAQQTELDRTMKLAETVTGVSSSLPIPSGLKWLRWNSAGTALENTENVSAGTLVSTIGAGLTLASADLSVTIPTRYAETAGTGAAYTASFTPALAAHQTGAPIVLKIATANTTTTPTFNPNGIGAVTIQRKNGTPLLIGDIPANYIALLVYNNTTYNLLNPYLLNYVKNDTVIIYPRSMGTSNVLLPNGTWLDTPSSTTQGLQEAINYASTYGYDLHITGGTEPITGGGIVYNCTTTLNFPAMQGKRITSGACTINFSVTGGTEGVVFNSAMVCPIDLAACQIVNGGYGPALVFRPINPVPVDNIITWIDTFFHVNAVVFSSATNGNAAVLFDAVTGLGDIRHSKFYFEEINAKAGAGQATNGIYVDVPTNKSFDSNLIDVGFLHSFSTTGLQLEGASTTTIYNNRWKAAISLPNSAGAKCIDTWGSNDYFEITENPAATLPTNSIVFESSASKNLVIVPKLHGADGTINTNNVVITGTKIKESSTVKVFDDFTTAVSYGGMILSDHAWTILNTASVDTGSYGASGFVLLGPATADTLRHGISNLTTKSFKLSGGNTLTFEARVKLSGVVAGYYYFGLMDADDLTGNGMIIAASGTSAIRAKNMSGGTPTDTDTGLTWTANTTYTFKIVATASQILFYVDGVLKATHTTNIPTAAMAICMFIRGTVTACAVDYVDCTSSARV